MALTERQKRFCDYYIETGNATEAARLAGYQGKNLKQIGSENLTKLDCKVYIDEKISKKDGDRIAKQDEVLEFLTSVLRGKVTEQFPLGLGMGEQSLVKKELDGKDRIKAAELLGKRYGIWTEKLEHSGSVVTIVDDIK